MHLLTSNALISPHRRHAGPAAVAAGGPARQAVGGEGPPRPAVRAAARLGRCTVGRGLAGGGACRLPQMILVCMCSICGGRRRGAMVKNPNERAASSHHSTMPVICIQGPVLNRWLTRRMPTAGGSPESGGDTAEEALTSPSCLRQHSDVAPREPAGDAASLGAQMQQCRHTLHEECHSAECCLI